MRRLLLALLAVTALGAGAYDAADDTSHPYDAHLVSAVSDGVAGGETVVFNAALSHNGIEPALTASSVAGLPAPDLQWWASDPLGAGGDTSHTWTATGSPALRNTPYCPDGDYSDVTATNCIKAREFTGSQSYLSPLGAFDPNSGDFTICWVSQGGENVAAAKALAGTFFTPGFTIYQVTTDSFRVYVENDSVPGTYAAINDVKTDSGWGIYCATYDEDGGAGGLVGYANGVADATTGVVAGGSMTMSTEKICIGAGDNGAGTCSAQATSRIAAFFAWYSKFSADQVADFSDTWMGVFADGDVHPSVRTNVGPTCCWIDGAIDCFSDNHAKIGCTEPPGHAAAATPTGGYFSQISYTNSVLYSRDLSTGWTDIPGAGVEACAQSATPFRDSRVTCRMTDDDAGNVEALSQAIDVTALDTSDTIMVCVYAYDPSGTVLDLQVDESGVCGGSSIDFAAKTIDTSWTAYEWTHTLADGTCTTATYKLSPADWAAAANTGTAHAVVQVYLDQDYCPPTYIETGASAVAAGADTLRFPDSTGALSGPWVVSFDYAPFYVPATNAIVQYLFGWDDGAAAGVLMAKQAGTPAPVQGYISGGWDLSDTTPGLAEGVYSSVSMDGNFDTDVYHLSIGGVVQDTSTTARTAPPAIDQVAVGVVYSASPAGQSVGGAAIKNVRITQ